MVAAQRQQRDDNDSRILDEKHPRGNWSLRWRGHCCCSSNYYNRRRIAQQWLQHERRSNRVGCLATREPLRRRAGAATSAYAGREQKHSSRHARIDARRAVCHAPQRSIDRRKYIEGTERTDAAAAVWRFIYMRNERSIGQSNLKANNKAIK